MRKYGRWTRFFFAALLLVAVAAILPQSGWLVRTELKMLGGGAVPGMTALTTSTANPAPDTERIRAVALARSDDYPIQLAAAIRTAPPSASDTSRADIRNGTIKTLLPLEAKFDDQPSLHAHILRYLCMGDLHIGRDEEKILWRPSEVAHSQKSQPPTAAALALTLSEAARGEALDPQNAFFPTMSAMALLAAHRDAEALAALHRAAQAPKWNDYGSDEARAELALSEAAYGKTGALSDVAALAAILFPDFAITRDLARETIALAILREQAGDSEGGFAIRHDIARLGATMRVESSCLIGSLVGDAITGISGARPGGAPVLDDSLKSEARIAAGDARYIAYLTRIGHPEEASWYLAERRAQEKSKSIFHQAEDSSLFSLKPLMWLIGLWGGGLLLLVNTLWMLLLGGIATLLSRTSRVRASQPLHRGIRWGFGLAAILVAEGIGVSGLTSLNGADGNAFLAVCMGAALLALPFIMLKRGEDWRGFRRNAGACLLTVASLGGLATLAALSMACSRGMTSSLGFLNALSGDGQDSSGFGTAFAVGALIGGLALAVPQFTLIALAIRSRIRRVPVSVGCVRGFRSASLPTAGVLLLLYLAVLGATLVQESNIRQQGEQSLTHEGRYYASLTNNEWPGRVDKAK